MDTVPWRVPESKAWIRFHDECQQVKHGYSSMTYAREYAEAMSSNSTAMECISVWSVRTVSFLCILCQFFCMALCLYFHWLFSVCLALSYCLCVCACVRACVRACVCACVCLYVCVFCIIMLEPLLMSTLCVGFLSNCWNIFHLYYVCYNLHLLSALSRRVSALHISSIIITPANPTLAFIGCSLRTRHQWYIIAVMRPTAWHLLPVD